jgi:hypothetical protein
MKRRSLARIPLPLLCEHVKKKKKIKTFDSDTILNYHLFKKLKLIKKNVNLIN